MSGRKHNSGSFLCRKQWKRIVGGGPSDSRQADPIDSADDSDEGDRTRQSTAIERDEAPIVQHSITSESLWLCEVTERAVPATFIKNQINQPSKPPVQGHVNLRRAR
jgi:hypothetical protein